MPTFIKVLYKKSSSLDNASASSSSFNSSTVAASHRLYEFGLACISVVITGRSIATNGINRATHANTFRHSSPLCSQQNLQHCSSHDKNQVRFTASTVRIAPDEYSRDFRVALKEILQCIRLLREQVLATRSFSSQPLRHLPRFSFTLRSVLDSDPSPLSFLHLSCQVL